MIDIDSLEITDAPTAQGEKNHLANPYWPVVEKVKDLNGKAAKFKLPTEDNDTFKKAAQRVRSRLNELSDHLGRTIRVKLTSATGDDAKDRQDQPLTGTVTAEVWVLDTKITRTKKSADKPANETPIEATEAIETPAEVPADTDAPSETETPSTRGNRRSRRN